MNLDEIIIQSIDQDIQEYEKRIEVMPEPSFSKVHYRTIKRAAKVSRIKLETREHSSNGIGIRVFKRAISLALIAVLILVSTVVAFANICPEYYMKIKKSLTYWTISFVTGDDIEENDQFVAREGKLPDGYIISSRTNEEGINTITYSMINDENMQIIYVQQKIGTASRMCIDAETDYSKHEAINGRDTIVTQKDDCYTFVWAYDGCAYTLVGNCDKEVLEEYIKTIE